MSGITQECTKKYNYKINRKIFYGKYFIKHWNAERSNFIAGMTGQSDSYLEENDASDVNLAILWDVVKVPLRGSVIAMAKLES